MPYPTVLAAVAAVLALLVAPIAVAESPLGTLHVSETAELAHGDDRVTLMDTSALYFDADKLDTATGARAVLELAHGLIAFGESTSASLTRTEGGYALSIGQGQLEIRMDASQETRIATPDFIVGPSEFQPAAQSDWTEMRLRVGADGSLDVESLIGALAIADRTGRVLERVRPGDTATLIARRAPETSTGGARTQPAQGTRDLRLGARTLGVVGTAGIVGGTVAISEHNDDDDDGSPQ